MNAYPLTDAGRIREPGLHAAPSLSFNLADEIRSLQSEEPWQAGHTAKTIVNYPDLRIVLVALKAGAQLVQHETTGRISIHTLSGYVRVRLPEKTLELPAGSMVALDRDIPRSVDAAADSAFLLTIAWSDQSPLAKANRPRVISIEAARQLRERGLDKTLADTYPCSDALSSVPDPPLKSNES